MDPERLMNILVIVTFSNKNKFIHWKMSITMLPVPKLGVDRGKFTADIRQSTALINHIIYLIHSHPVNFFFGLMIYQNIKKKSRYF